MKEHLPELTEKYYDFIRENYSSEPSVIICNNFTRKRLYSELSSSVSECLKYKDLKDFKFYGVKVIRSKDFINGQIEIY